MQDINRKYIVRLFDGIDDLWIDITKPISYEEAQKIWNEKTENGTKNTNFGDIDYYKIFSADIKNDFL